MAPRPCFFPGCSKFHQGRGIMQESGEKAYYCGQHGGGYRCVHPECTKLQQDMEHKMCRQHYKQKMGIPRRLALPRKASRMKKRSKGRIALANRTNRTNTNISPPDNNAHEGQHVQPEIVPQIVLQPATLQPPPTTLQNTDDDVSAFLSTLGLDKDDMFAVQALNATTVQEA